jgi:hypothetical protein
MASNPLNMTLQIFQGQTFDFGFQLTNADGTPRDLTGYAVRMQIRADVTDTDAIRTWSTTDGHIMIDGPTGTIAFNVSSAETYALPTQNSLIQWFYDMLLTSGGGHAERPVQGAVVVTPAVTRPDPVT